MEYGVYEIGGITEDGYPSNFPSAEIYYMNLANYWTLGTHLFELTEDDPYLNGTERTSFSSGEYLFYSLSADWFGIREAPAQSTVGSIPGYPLLVLGLISLVSILIISIKRGHRK